MIETTMQEEYDRGRRDGRADVAKYANAIGRIESACGISGAQGMTVTVQAVEEMARRMRLVGGVAAHRQRYADRYMQAAADAVLDEIVEALNGRGV